MRKFDENYSLIRVFHAVPGGDTVDIYINDRLFYKGLSFTQFTPYIYVPKGKYTLIVYGEDTTDNPILSQEVEVNNDELITMVLTGDTDDITLLPVIEDKDLADGNNSKLRFVHLVPNGLPVDIIIDNVTQYTDVKFRDITDTALTMNHVMNHLKAKNPNSVKSCVLLDKPSRRKVELVPDYCGFEIEDKFVVGYGLNYGDYYRNIPYVFNVTNEDR